MVRKQKRVEMKWTNRIHSERQQQQQQKENGRKKMHPCVIIPWYVWHSHYYRHNDHRIRLSRTHQTTTTTKLIESELKPKVMVIAIPSHLLIYDTVQVIQAFRTMECHSKYLNLGITLIWNMNRWVAIRYERARTFCDNDQWRKSFTTVSQCVLLRWTFCRYISVTLFLDLMWLMTLLSHKTMWYHCDW